MSLPHIRQAPQPLKRQRYPWEKPKEKRLTIAAGFVADDGVLLCADSLYSGGINVHGRKIFTHRLEGGSISFAIAGNEQYAKKAVDDAKEFLGHNLEIHDSIPSVRSAVEQVVENVWERYVQPVDAEREEARFQLLIAIGVQGQTRLFSAKGPVLTEVENYECVGSGYYVGHHLIQRSYRPRMSLEQVAAIAIRVLAIAKGYVEGVGGASQFEVIRNDDVTDTLWRDYPYDVATFLDMQIDSYERASADLLLDVGNLRLSDEGFEERLAVFASAATDARHKWRHHTAQSELFAAIRRSKRY